MSLFAGKGGEEASRKGVIVPVQYLDETEEYLMRALELFPSSGKDKKKSYGSLMPEPSTPDRRRTLSPGRTPDDDFTAVCSVAVRDAESTDDSELL